MNIKKCPTCHEAFSEDTIFCPNDSADLTSVRVEPETTSNQPAPETVTAGKVCPKCSNVNKSYAILCACGAELTGGQHTAASEQTKALPQSKLLLQIGNNVIECRSGDILGRNGSIACDIMQTIPTVSVEHVSFELQNGSWWVRNLPLRLNKTMKNATILDGKEIALGDSAELTGKHSLRLSSRCDVVLKIC